ncbi:major facilitator superfamily domain-containing protein [Coniochaeta sp. 2T2.1]|nr:major facilitator superfamily domain-containing protein [Coniochaeta sp. 2T2.1]
MSVEPKETKELRSEVADGSDPTLSDSAVEVEDDANVKIHAKTWLAIVGVGLIYSAQLFSLVGAGVQGNAIGAHFGQPNKVTWVTTPITILTVILSPIVTQAADYWGRKWLLIGMTFTGVIGSIVVARANNFNVVIIGFTITGIANGAQALVHVVTSEVLPRRWRGYGQATDMVATSVGAIGGLLAAGGLNRHGNHPEGFRTFYYIATGIFFVSCVLCAFAYSPPPTPKQREYEGRFWDKMAMLDWAGYLLLALFLVLFSVGLSYSKNPYDWSNPHVAAPFAIGIFFGISLVVYEAWVKKDGMIHHELFSHNRNFSIATVCSFGDGIAFFATNTYFAFQVSFFYEHDALRTVTHYALVFIVAIFASVATGTYISFVREVRWITVLAFLIFTSFFGGLASTDENSSTLVWGLPVLLGGALGISLNTLVTIAQISTPVHLISSATGVLIGVRSLGGVVGLAIYQALFVDELSNLPANVGGAVVEAGLPQSSVVKFITALRAENATALAAVPGATEEIIEIGEKAFKDTYLDAFHHVWIAAAAFVGATAIVAVFLFNPKKEFNMHVDAPVEKIEVERHAGGVVQA